MLMLMAAVEMLIDIGCDDADFGGGSNDGCGDNDIDGADADDSRRYDDVGGRFDDGDNAADVSGGDARVSVLYAV
ncbi:hypothetical protein DPMN_151117 [Dreissena polymorpha]|uniref:Uncharacterized protein n=1 Tax=Dreissena polymorpha TaxID=45954 RepID=A0A9D4FGJ2_DREPO|nr:hypothetical protein DPMN_151117 [Dreissena polymorpha]